MNRNVVLLPGDGIGPESIQPTVEILNAVSELEFDEHLFGGASIKEYGEPLTDDTLWACRRAGAVLFGAAGGLQWDKQKDPRTPRPEKGLLNLRKELGLFANLRPIRPHPALYGSSPLKEEVIKDADVLIVRELSSGIYYGEKGRKGDVAFDTCRYTKTEVSRVAHVAFGLATRKVTSVDKANVMQTSKLWRETVTEIGEGYDIELEHMLVDNGNFQIPSRPTDFDVVLLENMQGDILSDAAGLITGSLGMLPSASLGDKGSPGLFEPIHGSAPDIAGKGIANPLATFLSGALLLRYGFGMKGEATAIETAVDTALEDGLR